MTFTEEEYRLMRRAHIPTNDEKFLIMLDRACEFHRTNKDDPYGIDVAVRCALIEVREAFAESHGLPMLKREAISTTPHTD